MASFKIVAAIASFAVAGCANAATLPEKAPAAVSGVTLPPRCDGQKMTKKYAQLKVTLKTRESDFCIPEFHGYGGTLQYPAVDRPVKLVLRSATTNVYDDPQLGSGTAMFYLNLHFLAGTSFKAKFRSTGGLTSSDIQAGQPYSAYGIVTVGHLAEMLPPCSTTATQGAYGGVLSNLGHVFAGRPITGAGYGVIEIYSGAQLTEQC